MGNDLMRPRNGLVESLDGDWVLMGQSRIHRISSRRSFYEKWILRGLEDGWHDVVVDRWCCNRIHSLMCHRGLKLVQKFVLVPFGRYSSGI